MQIRKIKLKNFKQYKETGITFPDGLIGLIGKNGSGKSTIFEAISAAFYGRVEGRKEQIRNDNASPNAEVVIIMEFEDKGKNFTIIREYRGKSLSAKAELYEENGLIATGTQEVNKRLRRIINIDYDNFKRSFFAHQKDVASLLNQSPSERQKALRKMLGLEKMDKLEEKIKEEVKEKNAEIDYISEGLLLETEETQKKKEIRKLKTEIKQNEEIIGKENKSIIAEEKKYIQLKKRLSKLEELKTKHETLERNIEIEKNNLKNNSVNLKKSEEELVELNKAVKEYKKLLPKKAEYQKFEKEIEKLQALKIKFQEKVNVEEQIIKSKASLEKEKFKLSDEKEKLTKFDDIEKNISTIKQKKKEVEIELKGLEKLKKTIVKLVGSLSDRLEEKRDHLKNIESLGKGSVCPTCERPLEEHYDYLVGKYQNEIDKLAGELNKEENELEKIEVGIENLREKSESISDKLMREEKRTERRDAAKERILEIKENISSLMKETKKYETMSKSIGRVSFNEEELKSAKKELSRLKPLYERCLSLSKKGNEIPGKKKEITNLKEREKILKKNILELGNRLTVLNFDGKNYFKTKKEREEKESELNKLKDKTHQMEIELSELKRDLKNTEDALKNNNKLKKKIAYLQKEIELFDRLKMTVGNIKEKITSKELPQISAEASNLFSKMTQGRYYNLKIDDEFNFKVNRDDKAVDLTTLSGGEKDLASLCLRIAISKRISKLAGRNKMGFLALDEVFGSLDEERREELLAALHVISEEFRQIFIVSHNQDVQEEFPTRIMISKVNGFSKVELYQN